MQEYHSKIVALSQRNCLEKATMRYASDDEICLDVGIPGDSLMFKIKSGINSIYQTVYLMQSNLFIYQIKSTNMGYLEVKGF